MKRKPVKHHFWEGSAPEEIRAYNEANEGKDPGFILAENLERIEQTASDILTAANFPKTLKPSFSPPDVVLKRQIEAHGFDWESREGYAARVLYQCWLVRTSASKAQIAIHSMYLGSLLAEGAMHKHWERGFGVAKKLGEATNIAWGLPEERAAKRERLRRAFTDVRRKVASDTKAYAEVARQESVSSHTVRRAVKGQ